MHSQVSSLHAASQSKYRRDCPLQTKTRPSETRDYNTEHTYRVQQGSVKLQHYGEPCYLLSHRRAHAGDAGLELAKLSGLPESLMIKSTDVAQKLEAGRAQSEFVARRERSSRRMLTSDVLRLQSELPAKVKRLRHEGRR